MREKKVPVSVLLPEHVDNCIKKLAKESGRTKSAYIRQILRRYKEYIETRDDPEAKPVDWDIDKFYTAAVPADQYGSIDEKVLPPTMAGENPRRG